MNRCNTKNIFKKKKKKTEYLGHLDCGVHGDLVRPKLSIYSLEPFQNKVHKSKSVRKALNSVAVSSHVASNFKHFWLASSI